MTCEDLVAQCFLDEQAPLAVPELTEAVSKLEQAGLAERFVQVHAPVPGISRSIEACRKLNCAMGRPDRVLTQARPASEV